VVADAEDGKVALELVDIHQPDVVFTDIRMPVMDGIELIERLKEDYGTIETVIISGYDDFHYAQQALRYGAADYLLKPIEPDALNQTLERLLERFRAKRENYRNFGNWLQFCNEIADQLFDALWLLDEPQANAALERLRERLRSESPNKPFSAAMYTDVFKLLEERIRHKGNMNLNFDDAPRFTPESDPDDLARQASAALQRTISALRERTNWHSRVSMNLAKEFIDAHFREESLSLQQVAQAVDMSPSYFSRVFKEEFGLSFIQYVTKLRMEEAAKLLSDPFCKTYEVSYQVGYTDYSHFAKVFKKYYAVSPKEYKRRVDQG
jgi:two-component system response regulator YesN